MILKQWLSAILILLLVCEARSQSVSTASYTSLTAKTNNHLTEQIFVHTDKTFFVAGEILWFKVYCIERDSHKLLDLSKIAYIELLDSAHQSAVQAKVELQNGMGDGSLALPLGMSSGNYELRAYTNWMKNNGANDFFEKTLTVINTQKLTIDSSKRKQSGVSIHFFPEGGSLIEDINTKLGFKITDQYGKGVHGTGVLMDGKDSLLSFSDKADGIGSFSFIPVKNHTYSAKIQPHDGESFTAELPNTKESGFGIKVSKKTDNNIAVNIAAKGIEDQAFYLIVHQNRKAALVKELSLHGGKTELSIDTSALPFGVSAFTLFNMNKQPVAERLFYRRDTRRSALHITAAQPLYEDRKKVSLLITDKNKSIGENDSANLSLSVYRIDSLQALDQDDIAASFSFTSPLHVPIENGQHYIDEQGATNDALTDELMLVSGGYKFTNDKTGETTPLLSFTPEYRGHIVTGEIWNSQTGQPQKNTDVYLSLPGKGKQFYTSVSDANGNISLETEKWYGSSKLVVQTNNNNSSSTIYINDPFSHQYSHYFPAAFALPYQAPNTLLQHSISMQTENIYSNDERNRFAAVSQDSIPFFVTADKTYRLDDYTRFTTMEEVLREYIALVNVTKRKGEYHLPVYDFSSEKMFTGDPLVLVDGIPYFNLDSFIKLDPLKLRKLDVVNRRYFYGNTIFDGILNWQTYDGDAASIDIDPKAVIIDYDGLQQRREFYSPVYETESQLNSHVPDFRNVLYWNPHIILKKGEAKQLSFFTSDLPGKYAVQVQGITAEGNCISAYTFFDVAKK